MPLVNLFLQHEVEDFFDPKKSYSVCICFNLLPLNHCNALLKIVLKVFVKQMQNIYTENRTQLRSILSREASTLTQN